MPLSQTLKLAFRFSLREMRGGLSGFMIFLACIALVTPLAVADQNELYKGPELSVRPDGRGNRTRQMPERACGFTKPRRLVHRSVRDQRFAWSVDS